MAQIERKNSSRCLSAASVKLFTSAIVTLVFQLTITNSYVETQQQQSSFMALPDGIENVLGFKPRSSFKCTKDGYFGDVENDCKLFHLCQQTKYPNGKTEWRHWTYACGNQTMFNQLTLTCAFIDEAVPCQHSSQFQYLNEVIHRPKEPFLTDADVTSGVSYYHNRLLSDNARARAEQQQQQQQQQQTQSLPQTQPPLIVTSNGNNNRLNRPQQTSSSSSSSNTRQQQQQQQVPLRQVRIGASTSSNTAALQQQQQQQRAGNDRQAAATITTVTPTVLATTRTISNLSNNNNNQATTTTVPTTTLAVTNSMRPTSNNLIDFAIVTNHEIARAATNQHQRQTVNTNRRQPTTRSLSTPIVGVTFSSNDADLLVENKQQQLPASNDLQRSARQLSSSLADQTNAITTNLFDQSSTPMRQTQQTQRFTNRFEAALVRPISQSAANNQLMRRINLGRELLRQQIPLTIAMEASQDGDNRQLQDLFTSMMINANRHQSTTNHFSHVIHNDNFQSARVQPASFQQQTTNNRNNKQSLNQEEQSHNRSVRPSNSLEVLWRTSNASMPLTTNTNDNSDNNFIRRRL